MDLSNQPRQDQGFLGTQVGAMIRRNVKKRFRAVYWDVPFHKEIQAQTPVIFIANHFGWHDGYLMYLAVKKMEIITTDWIEEFDAFPPFAKIGGLPFPKNDFRSRAQTIRTTIRRMEQGSSLLLFAEGELHRGPGLRLFPPQFNRLIAKLPAHAVVPTAIVYDYSLHERPEATLRLGEPILRENASAEGISQSLSTLWEGLQRDVSAGHEYPLLISGTGDVNERFQWKQKRPGAPS